MNMLAVTIALAITVTCATGCGHYISRNVVGEPARTFDERWVKSGATKIDVRKALLECGEISFQPDPFVYEKVLGIRDFNHIWNHRLTVGGCMERAGFVQIGERGKASPTLAEYCARNQDRNFPACQPNAPIPKPSVERRLNSWYCKIKTDREYCRKHAFTPAACDDPKWSDYSNPPPECRP